MPALDPPVNACACRDGTITPLQCDLPATREDELEELVRVGIISFSSFRKSKTLLCSACKACGEPLSSHTFTRTSPSTTTNTRRSRRAAPPRAPPPNPGAPSIPDVAPPPPPPGFSGIYDGGKQGEYGFESEPPEPELLDPRWLLDAAAVQQPHNRRDGSPRNLTKQYLQLSGPMWA